MQRTNLSRMLFYLSIIFLFFLSGICGGLTPASANTPGLQSGVFVVGSPASRTVTRPTEQVSVEKGQAGTAKYRRVDFPDGQIYWMYRSEFNRDTPATLNLKFRIRGTGGTFSFYNPRKQLVTVPLTGTLPKAAGFIQTSEATWYISYPAILQNLPRHSVQEKYTSLPLQVSETREGYELLIRFPRQSGTFGEIWAVGGTRQSLNWQDPLVVKAFRLLGQSQQMKWSWDGYYDLAPDSYVPGGRNVYWRFPDNYVARSLVEMNEQNPLGRALGWVMLKIGSGNQNSRGYWESAPVSGWLWKEYGIGGGFFDTRFNSDFARLLLQGYTTYKEPGFLAGARRYAGWLNTYAETKHVTTVAGGRTGWLLPDYFWPQKARPTHTSLNHQLAEINFLYHLYELTGETRYEKLAEKLLNGVRNTRGFWGKPDGSLRYAYLRGREVGEDYPYLTYNDLWETQQFRVRFYGKADRDLELLMAGKKRWMDRHGITGYKR
ncbi:MAG TPA: hypothetical protein VHS59_13715 [Bacillota bacterium]|nr:hypothetical protein [Bacillota bacterium]